MYLPSEKELEIYKKRWKEELREELKDELIDEILKEEEKSIVDIISYDTVLKKSTILKHRKSKIDFSISNTNVTQKRQEFIAFVCFRQLSEYRFNKYYYRKVTISISKYVNNIDFNIVNKHMTNFAILEKAYTNSNVTYFEFIVYDKFKMFKSEALYKILNYMTHNPYVSIDSLPLK